MEINFVTSSQNKIQELSEVLGEQFTVNQLQAELPEHQSMDLHEIIEAKLKSAQEIHPDKIIIVEDTAFEIDALNGLPGPFIKFFELAVGDQGVYEMARGVQNDGALSAKQK